MEKINESKCLLVMANSLFFIFLATSCTSDEFFGIEEDYDGLDYSLLEKIAYSKEYIEYQKQSLLYMEELSKKDTTQVEYVDSIGGKAHYVLKQTFSIKSVYEAKCKLSAKYPEYDNSTPAEKDYIFNIAVNSNGRIRTLAKKYFPNAIRSTKSVNYESCAVQYILSAREHSLINGEGGYDLTGPFVNSMWYVNELDYFFAYNNYVDAMCEAVLLANRDSREYSGLAWEFDDGSGILIDSPLATSTRTHIPSWSGPVTPTFDFHIHPVSGIVKRGSKQDSIAWHAVPWCEHHIINREYQEYIHILY